MFGSTEPKPEQSILCELCRILSPSHCLSIVIVIPILCQKYFGNVFINFISKLWCIPTNQRRPDQYVDLKWLKLNELGNITAESSYSTTHSNTCRFRHFEIGIPNFGRTVLEGYWELEGAIQTRTPGCHLFRSLWTVFESIASPERYSTSRGNVFFLELHGTNMYIY